MNTGDDPYDILSVSKEAKVEEIRKAYRKLAVKHHPDKFLDPVERDRNSQIFSRIAAAYEILSDDRCRAEYDRQQVDDVDDRGRPPGFDGNAVYDVPPSARRETNKSSNSAATAHKTSTTGKAKKKHPMHFHDPYEVFKAAFEAEFGFPYPGADYDNIPEAEMKRQMKLKDANSRKPKLLTNGDAGSTSASTYHSGSDDTKTKGGFLGGVFGGGKKAPSTSSSNETALVMHDRNKNKAIVSRNTSGKTSNALVKKKTGSIVPRDPSGGDGDEYGPPPGGNNRPASMETREYKIEHPDGTIETIEETTITRPDGSTETMRRTDKPDSKTGNWKKPVSAASGGGGNNLKAIGNGPEKKLLTNGNEKKKLAIDSDKAKGKATTKKPVLAIEDAPKEKTGRRLLGWGGGKS